MIATIGDATFHDKAPVNGRKVDAEDVVQSSKRFRREAPIGYSWLHEIIETIDAVDEKTVKITAEAPVGVVLHVVERGVADQQLDPAEGDPRGHTTS